MAEQENVAISNAAYAAFGRGDIRAVLEVYDEEIEWVIPGPTELPWAGSRRGKQAVGQWFQTIGLEIEFTRFEPYQFIAQGDTVVVLVHVAGRMRRSGREFVDEEANVETYRNGKLVRFLSFGDTAGLLAAYRGAPSS